ncbi:MAG TPA: hypothetical protein DEB09_04135 [Candidatus Magasanikbacteria bacterium]|nr:hypothetical protein [Candidatus Magasanikbacteria bacterium]
MDWKKFLSLKHHYLNPLHHYQMDVVLLFVIYFFSFIYYFVKIDSYGLDINTYQWYFFIPLILLYSIYNLKQRNKIAPKEFVSPLKRPIAHWILLGISSIAIYLQPLDLVNRPQSLIFAFIIFSLFFADGYWDFKNTKLWKKNGRS